MKKIYLLMLTAFMTLAVCPAGVCAEEGTYIDIINNLIEKYGSYEEDENHISTGVIYGEWIDFDNNGTEEMLVVCKEKTNEYRDNWAEVFVYGTENGNIIKLLDMPVCGYLGQTDVSYHIATGETDGKAYIVFDTKTIGTETGYSERVVSFTMAENKAVTHQYYGEVLNWEDAWTSDYTKCMIDGNDVSVEDYCSALEKINFHDWLLLFAGNDYDTDRFCSREKIDAFIEETKDKSGSVSKASNEITGTLSKQFIGYGVGDDVECLIMTLDTPQNFCVTDTEGKTFMAENVKEVQIGAKNYNESMNGSKVKIKSYDEMFEGHSFYHIRPVVITGAELEEVKDDITVTLNGEAIEFDQSPIIVDGRTLVPLRAIFEALGATVDWNGETKTVTSTKDGTTISMTIGKAEMYKNGEVKELNVASQIVGGRTLVPVRAIAESFNVNVDWDGDTRTVILCGN